MINFNVEKETKNIIQWIKDYFNNQPSAKGAVIGISGGKDSTIVAKLLVEALGKEKVVGIIMPQYTQSDIQDAHQVISLLDIKYVAMNIGQQVDSFIKNVNLSLAIIDKNTSISEQAKINIPARLRMTTLYAVAQSIGGYRVVNTCNLSEDYIGYSTKFGDMAGDFSPLSDFTVTEVIKIGEYLGLPENLIKKVPSDGLCGKTDEDSFGFTYEILDKYIRTGICSDLEIKEKIDKMHEYNLHKVLPMPKYER